MTMKFGKRKSRKLKFIVALFFVLFALLQGTPVYAADYGEGGTDLEDIYFAVLPSGGNHAKYVDRIKMQGYALDFYNALEDSLKDEGFLINPEQEKYSINVKGSSFYGIKVAETKFFESSTSDVTNGVAKAIGWNISVVYDAFLRDHPEIFWITNEFRQRYFYDYKTEDDKEYIKIICCMDFERLIEEEYKDVNVLKEAISERDRLVEEIVGQANKYSSVVEKAVYFHDWLTYHNEYNSVVSNDEDAAAPSDSYECISALRGMNGENGPVCEGYAKAFQVLCNYIGIDCAYVHGNYHVTKKGNKIGHAWNLIEIGGAWYGVDVTWDDPTGTISNGESHKYLFVGSDTKIGNQLFSESHKSEGLLIPYEPVMSKSEYDLSLFKTKNVLAEDIEASGIAPIPTTMPTVSAATSAPAIIPTGTEMSQAKIKKLSKPELDTVNITRKKKVIIKCQLKDKDRKKQYELVWSYSKKFKKSHYIKFAGPKVKFKIPKRKKIYMKVRQVKDRRHSSWKNIGNYL